MLPAGFRLALDPGVRWIDGGKVVVGGAPIRMLRLTPAGQRTVHQWADGEPVARTPGAQALARRLLDAGIAHPRPAGGTFTEDDVTVVIPVLDDEPGLRATLAALGSVRVVVVDDGSSRPVPVAPEGVTVIRHPENRGAGAARNSGLGAVTTPLVAFLDANCEPASGWLTSLLVHFDDPAVVMAAPRITARIPEALAPWLGRYESLRSPLDLGPREAPVRPRGVVTYVPTAAVVARSDAVRAAGGFDETMPFGEDVDLVWRLVAAGAAIRYEPRSTVVHPARPTARSLVRQRFSYGTAAAPLARRHGKAVAPLAVSGWSAGVTGLVAAGHPVLGTGVGAGTVALLAPRLGGIEGAYGEAARLAGLGHVYAARSTADAVRRAWLPFAVGAALVSRRARWALVACALAPAVEWFERRPAIDLPRWLAARLVDDVSYGAGVWAGCLRERSFAALVPDLTDWPGRRKAVEE